MPRGVIKLSGCEHRDGDGFCDACQLVLNLVLQEQDAMAEHASEIRTLFGAKGLTPSNAVVAAIFFALCIMRNNGFSDDQMVNLVRLVTSILGAQNER